MSRTAEARAMASNAFHSQQHPSDPAAYANGNEDFDLPVKVFREGRVRQYIKAPRKAGPAEKKAKDKDRDHDRDRGKEKEKKKTKTDSNIKLIHGTDISSKIKQAKALLRGKIGGSW